MPSRSRPVGRLARQARFTGLLKGGLESQPSDGQSDHTRRNYCLPDAGPQLHALRPGAAGTLLMVASTKSLAQGKPSYDRAGTWRRLNAWLDAATRAGEHARRRYDKRRPGAPAGLACPIRRWTSFTERLTTAARRTLRPSQGTSGAPATNLGGAYAPSRPKASRLKEDAVTELQGTWGRAGLKRPISPPKQEEGRKRGRKLS